MGFGSPLSVQSALFRIAHLAPCQEEGARKGALKIVCFTIPDEQPRLVGIPYLRTKHKENVKQLLIGSWNVRTLMDNLKADRPERRTALVARELARYHVDIAALSETRIANEGQVTEDGGGYCFFWNGRTSEKRREAGVGFDIRSHLVSKLTSLPRGLNDRLMVMQLQLTNAQMATLFSAYAPTMTNPEEVKNQFYEQLDALIAAVPKSEKLIILRDVNNNNNNILYLDTLSREETLFKGVYIGTII